MSWECEVELARPARLERATFGFGDRHSIHLSYGREGLEFYYNFALSPS